MPGPHLTSVSAPSQTRAALGSPHPDGLHKGRVVHVVSRLTDNLFGLGDQASGCAGESKGADRPLACAAHVTKTMPERLQSTAYDRRRTREYAQHGGPSSCEPVRGGPHVASGLAAEHPGLKRAIKAERAAFDLKRALQRLEVKDGDTIQRREPLLPEVRRGGKVVDIESLLHHEDRHDDSGGGVHQPKRR